jgi:hypothetical protein
VHRYRQASHLKSESPPRATFSSFPKKAYRCLISLLDSDTLVSLAASSKQFQYMVMRDHIEEALKFGYLSSDHDYTRPCMRCLKLRSKEERLRNSYVANILQIPKTKRRRLCLHWDRCAWCISQYGRSDYGRSLSSASVDII